MSDDEYNVKLDRCQYFEREWIPMDVKKAVAKKTDGRCAMCGKKIKLGDSDFTIDHFIPLNKGGSNDIKNLVPLCYDCNQEKANIIMSNYKRMPYLKSKYKRDLIKISGNFLNNYIWLNGSNILMYDDEIVDVQLPIYELISRTGKIMYRTVSLKIKKETEPSEEINEFIKAYNEKYGIETYYIPTVVGNYIKRGLLYTVRDKSNKLLYVITFSFLNYTETSEDGTPYGTCECIEIGNIVCSTNLTTNVLKCKAALYRIITEDIWQSAMALGLHTLTLAVEMNTNEKGYENLLSYISMEATGCEFGYAALERNKDTEGFKSFIFDWYTGHGIDIDTDKKHRKKSERMVVEEIMKLARKERKIFEQQIRKGRVELSEEDYPD